MSTASGEAAERAAERVEAVVAQAKPYLRGWLHAGTFPLAMLFGAALIWLASPGPATVAAVVYTVTSSALFGVSALYHRGTWSPRAHGLLKRIDHANIYLIIAGSYTPFVLLGLEGTTRTVVLKAVWAGALLGAVFRVVWVDAPRWLYTPLYALLGWAAVFVLPQLLDGAGAAAVTLVAVGGVLYTAGALVYALQRPDPSPRYFGFHEVFHAFTVAAFAVQAVAVWLVMHRG